MRTISTLTAAALLLLLSLPVAAQPFFDRLNDGGYSGNIEIHDDQDLRFGTGDDATISFTSATSDLDCSVTGDLDVDATATVDILAGTTLTLTATTTFDVTAGATSTHTVTDGDLILDNQDVDDDIILTLGSDDANTSFVMRNNSEGVAFEVTGAGQVTFPADPVLSVGSGAEPVAPIDCEVTQSGEVADVIDLDLACVDASGVAVTSALLVWVRCYSDVGLTTITDGDHDIGDNGDGAIVLDDEGNLSFLLYRTSATGTANIDVTDQLSASGETHYCEIVDGGNTGGRRVVGTLQTLTWD